VGSITRSFGFINWVDNVNWPRDSTADVSYITLRRSEDLVYYCVCYHGKHRHRFGEARNHIGVSRWVRDSLQHHTQTFHAITHTPLLVVKGGGDLECLNKRRKIILLDSKFSFTFYKIHGVQVKFFVVLYGKKGFFFNVLFLQKDEFVIVYFHAS